MNGTSMSKPLATVVDALIASGARPTFRPNGDAVFVNEAERSAITLLVGHTNALELREVIHRLEFSAKDTGDVHAHHLIMKIEQAVFDWYGEPLNTVILQQLGVTS